LLVNTSGTKYNRDLTQSVELNSADENLSGKLYAGIFGFDMTTTNTFDIDWIVVYTTSTITMNGLATGQKFKIYDSGLSLVATSGAASGGIATLTDSSPPYSTRPPYGKIAVTDTDGSTILLDNLFLGDVYWGDTYTYAAKATV
jgi:hypothetical protein